MSSEIDKLLDHVDEWKAKVHEKLSEMSAVERKAYWKEIHDEARARGLKVAPKKQNNLPGKSLRKTA